MDVSINLLVVEKWNGKESVSLSIPALSRIFTNTFAWG
jgi:hypothetical protein